MEVFWSVFAEDDLDAIFDYYTDKGEPDVAVRTTTEIRRKADSLVGFPYMGGIGRVPETRELLAAGKYYIVYRISAGNIHILNIIHTSRKYPPDCR